MSREDAGGGIIAYYCNRCGGWIGNNVSTDYHGDPMDCIDKLHDTIEELSDRLRAVEVFLVL